MLPLMHQATLRGTRPCGDVAMTMCKERLLVLPVGQAWSAGHCRFTLEVRTPLLAGWHKGIRGDTTCLESKTHVNRFRNAH